MIQQVIFNLAPQINIPPNSFMRQKKMWLRFSCGFFPDPCCSDVDASIHHIYLTEVGQTQSKKFEWRLGKGIAFSQDSNREQLLKSLIPPVNCALSRHSINQPGSWSMNRTGCWASVMSRFRHKTRPVGGSSRDRWGLRLMSLQWQLSHFIRFRLVLVSKESRLVQAPLIKTNCTHPLWRCWKRTKLTQL